MRQRLDRCVGCSLVKFRATSHTLNRRRELYLPAAALCMPCDSVSVMAIDRRTRIYLQGGAGRQKNKENQQKTVAVVCNNNLALWTNGKSHRPFKAECPGSSPGSVTTGNSPAARARGCKPPTTETPVVRVHLPRPIPAAYDGSISGSDPEGRGSTP